MRVKTHGDARALRSHGRRAALASLLALCIGGCGTVPQAPAGFDPGAAEFNAAVAQTEIEVDGPSGKWAGAGIGAAKGAGIGALVGLLSEAGCTWLCGAATVGGAILGSGAGALIGALGAEGADAVQAKHDLLKAAFERRPYAAELTQRLRTQAGRGAMGPTAARWQVAVALTEAGSVGHGVDQPYAVRLQARLEIRRVADASPAVPTVPLIFSATSAARRTMGQWRADGGAGLDAAFDECIQSLAAQVHETLRPAGPSQAASSPVSPERSRP